MNAYVNNVPSLPDGPYDIILAAPPWRFKTHSEMNEVSYG